MYDVDGNGFIDIIEMTKIVRSIYNMMGPRQVCHNKAIQIFIYILKMSLEQIKTWKKNYMKDKIV